LVFLSPGALALLLFLASLSPPSMLLFSSVSVTALAFSSLLVASLPLRLWVLCFAIALLLLLRLIALSSVSLSLVLLSAFALLAFWASMDTVTVLALAEILGLVSVGLLMASPELAWRYLVVGWLGTVSLVSGVLLVYGASGSFAFDAMAFSPLGVSLLSIGLVLKLGMGFAMGLWLSYAAVVPVPIALVLDCVIKAPLLGMLFLVSSWLPSAVFLVLGLLSIAVGGLGFSFADDRSVVAYSGGVQLGLFLAVLPFADAASLESYAALYLISVGLWWSLLGLGVTPSSRFAMVALLLSFVGIPGVGGFVVKFLVYRDMISAFDSVAVMLIPVLVMLCSMGYVRLCGRVFMGSCDTYGELPRGRECSVWLGFGVFVIAIGWLFVVLG
jgi:formate hydrogenlyase subunit 3/multisubunit Na+/H+ antiporter MnhD subunit